MLVGLASSGSAAKRVHSSPSATWNDFMLSAGFCWAKETAGRIAVARITQSRRKRARRGRCIERTLVGEDVRMSNASRFNTEGRTRVLQEFRRRDDANCGGEEGVRGGFPAKGEKVRERGKPVWARRREGRFGQGIP